MAGRHKPSITDPAGAENARPARRWDLNDAWLRTQKPPAKGRLEIRDTRVVGLVLRMTPNGLATWSIRTRTRDGKQTRPKLGTWPAMGIADARKQAMVKLSEVQKGSDPVAEARDARSRRREQAQQPTVATRLSDWQDARERDRVDPWSPRYTSEVRRVCNQAVVPAIGQKPLRDTTREDWTRLLRRRKEAGAGAAAFLYRTVSSFLNYAEAHGWIDHPLLPRKGASTIAPSPPPRERVLSDTEIRAVWQAAERVPVKLRTFVRLLILTAAREREAANIATGELDLDACRWTIPASRTKNKRPITVPLHPLLTADLRAVWPNHDAGEDWRLLGRIRGSGFSGFGRLKQRIDAASGVADWCWHDLRRTARTAMTRLGVPRDHAEAAINHISGRSKLERTYDVHDYADEIVTALSRWQMHVASLVSAAPTAEVIQIRNRKNVSSV